jgi:hypothetical protein
MASNPLVQTAEMLERRRRRQLQFAQPAWRIQWRRVTVENGRIDTRVVREESGRGEAKQVLDRFAKLAAGYAAATDMNVELQEREAGRSRYQPVWQAVGGRLLKW